MSHLGSGRGGWEGELGGTRAPMDPGGALRNARDPMTEDLGKHPGPKPKAATLQACRSFRGLALVFSGFPPFPPLLLFARAPLTNLFTNPPEYPE